MTSDVTKEINQPTQARNALTFALNGGTIDLKEFSAQELVGLLYEYLQQVKLAQLRVFDPLRMTMRIAEGTMDRSYEIDKEVSLFPGGSNNITFDTHSVWIPGGHQRMLLQNDCTYRHMFEERETTDFSVANKWKDESFYPRGRRYSVLHAQRSALQLVKTGPKATAADSLYLVEYKIGRNAPHMRHFTNGSTMSTERVGIVHKVTLRHIDIQVDFLDIMEHNAASVARYIIRGINTLIRSTRFKIEKQIKDVDPLASEFKRLVQVIK